MSGVREWCNRVLCFKDTHYEADLLILELHFEQIRSVCSFLIQQNLNNPTLRKVSHHSVRTEL